MKQQCEDRLKYFETGEKPPKNVDVMHAALQESLVLQEQVTTFKLPIICNETTFYFIFLE
jgi:hypothetical protein